MCTVCYHAIHQNPDHTTMVMYADDLLSPRVIHASLWPMESGVDAALLMHLHLRALELIQLFPDCRLVSRGELRPGLVATAIVVLSIGALHILMETQDFPSLELSHCGSLTELPGEPPFDLTPLCPPVCLILGLENVSLLQLHRCGSLAQPPAGDAGKKSGQNTEKKNSWASKWTKRKTAKY